MPAGLAFLPSMDTHEHPTDRKAQYARWIETYVQAHNCYVRGLCVSAVKEMIAAFPELKPDLGFVGWGEHAWCVAPDGEIVDPTASQFAIQPPVYVPWTPGTSVSAGRCGNPNCGESLRVYPRTREQLFAGTAWPSPCCSCNRDDYEPSGLQRYRWWRVEVDATGKEADGLPYASEAEAQASPPRWGDKPAGQSYVVEWPHWPTFSGDE